MNSNINELISKDDEKPDLSDLRHAFHRHLKYTLVKDKYAATPADLYLALAHAVRDMLADRWLDTSIQDIFYRFLKKHHDFL